jgi:predicted house-cleaning NTP pyrophosphatase (Maf/HAM1 superfamily)
MSDLMTIDLWGKAHRLGCSSSFQIVIHCSQMLATETQVWQKQKNQTHKQTTNNSKNKPQVHIYVCVCICLHYKISNKLTYRKANRYISVCAYTFHEEITSTFTIPSLCLGSVYYELLIMQCSKQIK